MKGLFDGEFGWSTIGMLVLIGGIGVGLVCLLRDVWKFDRGTSPAWQVGVYHLVLALLFVMTFVFASRRPFAFSVGFRRFTLAAWVLVPVFFFCWGWLVRGIRRSSRLGSPAHVWRSGPCSLDSNPSGGDVDEELFWR